MGRIERWGMSDNSPLERKFANFLTKGILSLINSATGRQTAQVAMLADEDASLPYVETYGFTSCPNSGAETVSMFYDGDKSHGIVIKIDDRRYRLKGLKAGEVAIYDDADQSIVLTKSGIVIDGGGKPITVKNTPQMTFDTPLATFTGNIVANGEIADQGGKKSMSGMRSTFNAHTHDETQTTTSPPKQEM